MKFNPERTGFVEKIKHLVARWRSLDGVISTLISSPDCLENNERLGESFADVAALETEILARAGGFDAAAIKLEIALRYADVAGRSSDPAWQFVRSALDDIGRGYVACGMCGLGDTGGAPG